MQKDSGSKRLVAYVVPQDESLTATDLKSFLAETLPSYMVPSAFVFLSKLPTNTHGKIDRKALMRYSPQPYPGKMTLFRAQQKDPKQFYDACLGWQYLIEGELEIHNVPRHHMSLMLEPHVKVLATELQRCLNALQADSGSMSKQNAKEKKQ